MAKPRTRLPDQTQPRIRILVERSAPDPRRPYLSDELELAFERVDRESAACYASAEDLSHRLRRAADRAEAVVQIWPPPDDECP
jgi:hypothetical protein